MIPSDITRVSKPHPNLAAHDATTLSLTTSDLGLAPSQSIPGALPADVTAIRNACTRITGRGPVWGFRSTVDGQTLAYARFRGVDVTAIAASPEIALQNLRELVAAFEEEMP